jgi:excisionase family DNA binding protein
MTDELKQLRKTFEALRQALEAAESALIEFEESLESSSTTDRSQARRGLDLLSIPEVCKELGMGKSWVYQRIRSGEIPSVKLGHNIKVRRKALEECLESNAYRPSKDALLKE